MNIYVLVKQVPDTTEITIDKETNTLVRTGVPNICNPDDLAGVEEALRLKEKYENVTVTTVTMGPTQAEDMIRELLARGVDNAYLLTDRVFAGSDTWATSLILSSFLKTQKIDLLIAGYQAIDGDTAQVGPQIAELLDMPQATYVQKIETLTNDSIIVEKRYEDKIDKLEITLPCLITTIHDMNEPRYMNAWKIYECFDKEINIITNKELNLDLSKIGLKGSPTKVKKSFPKQVIPKSAVEKLTPEKAAKKIAKIIYPNIEVNK